MSPVFARREEELVCPTAPRVRPHSARLCAWPATEGSASRSNPSSTSALSHQRAPPRPPALVAEGTRAGLGRVSQGRRCLSYRRLRGQRRGRSGVAWRGARRGRERGCAGVEDTMLTVRERDVRIHSEEELG